MSPVGPGHGVYGITTAAGLVGMDAQRLRMYEARGLLQPDRTGGGTRRYSANDLHRLQRIDHLLDIGLNLAGIAMVLRLEDENTHLREPAPPHPRHPHDDTKDESDNADDEDDGKDTRRTPR